MLILRRIASDGIEINHVIGDNYIYIHREHNPKEFRETFKKVFERDHVADNDKTADKNTKNVYAFVCYSIMQPLYKSQKNFMMTESGTTFANLTYK